MVEDDSCCWNLRSRVAVRFILWKDNFQKSAPDGPLPWLRASSRRPCLRASGRSLFFRSGSVTNPVSHNLGFCHSGVDVSAVSLNSTRTDPNPHQPMLLFIDESGHDLVSTPYEVLAGMAVAETELWNLIEAIRSEEMRIFGINLRAAGAEIKGVKSLKKKTFRLASEGAVIPEAERRDLVRTLLLDGVAAHAEHRQAKVTSRQLVAYGQARLDFIRSLFALMGRFRVRVFAAMVENGAPRPTGKTYLRKDYAFLLERFFYYLEDRSTTEMGLVVFDELDKARSRILIDQLGAYCRDTLTGYVRSSRIVPEPFFVHSDLTTVIQLADIVAYSLNWGTRLNRMTKPTRPELEEFANAAFNLRYVGRRQDVQNGDDRPVYGVFYLDDLRPRNERS